MPIAIIKNLKDDSHVETRIKQYEAIRNGKGFEIAKRLVIGKLLGENLVLMKYDLKPEYRAMESVENLQIPSEFNVKGNSEFIKFRNQLLNIEGRRAEYYFNQIFTLFPKDLIPERRVGHLAYDSFNNVFNLAYQLLFYKCYTALIKSHLEPYLGFLHNIQYGRLSLVCDFQELYRNLIDDFLIGYCKNLRPEDFKAKEQMVNNKKGKRMFLENPDEMIAALHAYFKKTVSIPRVKRFGEKQELESFIGEEAIARA